MERKEADKLVNEYIDTRNLIYHSYAVEAVMKDLAKKLEPAEEKLWGLTGLLHDLDYDKLNDDFVHGEKTVNILKEKSLGNEKMYKAILAHNWEQTGYKPQTPIEKSIYSADPITGLIVATALVHPNSKLKNVKVSSVMKKIDDSSFSKSVNRDAIKASKNLGLELDEFVEISLNAMKKISDKIGL
ncbi:MAG: HD domain-containing protein [Bacillota bacterium]